MSTEENKVVGENDVIEPVEVVEPEETEVEETESGEAESEGEEAEGEESEGEGESGEGEEGKEAPLDEKIVKFKAGVFNKETGKVEQQEYEIDKKFHSLMKDPETATMIRELHHKAYGLDAVKGRLAQASERFSEVAAENTEIKSAVEDLRGIVRGSLQPGGIHKLDKFFQRLNIPLEHVVNYAVAKVQLQEMAPEERQALEARLATENRAEELERQNAQVINDNARFAHELRMSQLEFVLKSPDVSNLAEEFDSRFDKPGAFKKACQQEGRLAWQEQRRDLTPQEAVKAVIEKYALTSENPLVPGSKKASPGSGAGGGTKTVVKRTTATLPNVSGSRSSSPLKSKPKSVEDLKKIAKERYG